MLLTFTCCCRNSTDSYGFMVRCADVTLMRSGYLKTVGEEAIASSTSGSKVPALCYLSYSPRGNFRNLLLCSAVV